MKRSLKITILLLSVLLLVVCFASCKKHAHSYSEDWSFDEESHWHSMTCKHKGTSEKEAHTWDAGVLPEGSECGPDTIATFTCTTCGATKTAKVSEHIYSPKEAKAPTCTKIGYTIYGCTRCGSECVADFVDATGHNYGEDIVTKAATCLEGGKYEKVCANCGDTQQNSVSPLGHSYIVVSEDETATTYECRNCLDSVVVNLGETFEQFYGEEELFDVEVDFSFDILTDKDEAYIRENLKIVDNYFYGSEYENDPDVIQLYNLVNKGDGVWTVSPVENYEHNATFTAAISGEINFKDYRCNVLNFTTVEDPDHVNTYEYNEGIIFIRDLENRNPGYYPYELSTTENSENVYLTLSKIDGLEIGRIICVGEITSFEECDESKEYLFGKIVDIYPLPSGQWMLVLTDPEIYELFDSLDISYDELINFDTVDIDIAQIEDAVVAALYQSEDFIKFLSVINLSLQDYMAENNIDSSEVESIASFMDKMKITPNVKVNGTKITSELSGLLEIPFKDKNKNSLGSFKVSFKYVLESSFNINVGYAIKTKWWVPVGIEYFDVSLTQNDTLSFNFDIEIEFDYSYEQGVYLQNIESGKIHRRGCAHITSIKDQSKIKDLYVIEAEELISKNPNLACKHCKPVEGFNSEILVINRDTKAIHCYNCTHVSQMSESNKMVSTEKAAYWIARDYTCCDWCHPDSREEMRYQEYLQQQLNCKDWHQVAVDISQWATDCGVKDRSDKGVEICRFGYYIWGPVKAELVFRFVFSLEIEASVKYEFKYNQVNTYGMRIQNGRANPYTSKTSKVLANDLTLMGKAELRIGFMVDANVTVQGLSSKLRAGVTAEIGMYANLYGILRLSSVSHENYAAAYFEAGVYIDVKAYYKVFWWENDFTLYAAEFPFFTMGYEYAYYAYENYVDKIVIDTVYNIAAEDLLKVKYFKLDTNMTTYTGELSMSETSKYRVIITFEDGRYCYVDNGVIRARDNAPCIFTDKMTITVECDDSWKDYRKGKSVFYLGEYEIDIEFHSGKQHSYTILEKVDCTCVTDGYEKKLCTTCNYEVTERLAAPGHDFVWLDGYEATCTSTGLTDGSYCNRCESIIVPQYEIPMLDHIPGYEWIIDIPATCTEEGSMHRDCIVCHGVAVTEVIPPNGHTRSNWIIDIQPTCTERGSRHIECLVCYEILETESIRANGHTYSDWIVDLQPTCTAEGSQHKECTVCRVTLVIEAISALGHDTVYHEAKEPTCTEIGWYAYETCNRCSYNTYVERAANGHALTAWILDENTSGLNNCIWNPTYTRTCHCGYAEHKTEAPFGHDITSWSVVVAPTQETTGELARGCVRQGGCGNRESIILPTLTEENVANGTYTVVITEPTYEREGSEVYTYSIDGQSFSWTVILPMKVASQGLQYTLSDDGTYYSLTSVGTCTDTHIVIPDTHNELPVSTIGTNAFYNCSKITSIEIPYSITTCESNAFYGCKALKDVYITDMSAWCKISFATGSSNPMNNGANIYLNGEIVEELIISNEINLISKFAFYKCKSIKKISVDNENSLTEISSYAFGGCDSLEIVEIPSSVTSIGREAFYGAKKLVSVIWCTNSQLTLISNSAFSNCSLLSNIEIPNTVTTIEEGAFRYCYALKAVYITDIESWCRVDRYGDELFANGASLYLNGVLVNELIIPNSVITFGRGAFYGCTSITSVTIPASVTNISDWLFYNCTSIKSVSIDENAKVKLVGNNAFGNCKSLESINIPNSVTSVGIGSFQGCSKLSNVILAPNTRIGYVNSQAFMGCTSLETIDFSNSLGYIGTYSFSGCGITSINLENVGIVAYCAFSGCTKLETVLLGDNVLVTIEDYAFENCKSLKNIDIPSSVQKIGSRAFSGCESITSIFISSKVLTIGEGAFLNCNSLAEIRVDLANANYMDINGDLYSKNGDTLIKYASGKNNQYFAIPSSVTTIETYAFSGCEYLLGVDIPDSIASIGSGAFNYCYSLESIYIPNTVITVSPGTFSFCDSLVEIRVDDSHPSYITIDGNLYSKDGKTLVRYAGGKAESCFVVPNGVTAIGGAAFSGSKNLKEVVISSGVESIGIIAFSYCNLDSIKFMPNSKLKTVEQMAFGIYVTLKDIYYSGTAQQWRSISVGSANGAWTSAIIHCNYVYES